MSDIQTKSFEIMAKFERDTPEQQQAIPYKDRLQMLVLERMLLASSELSKPKGAGDATAGNGDERGESVEGIENPLGEESEEVLQNGSR